MVRFDPSSRAVLEQMIRSSFPNAHVDDRSKAPELDLTKYAAELQDLVEKFGLRVFQGTGEPSIHCSPASEDRSCQPLGATDAMPATCAADWTHNEVGCSAPLLPPGAQEDFE